MTSLMPASSHLGRHSCILYHETKQKNSSRMENFFSSPSLTFHKFQSYARCFVKTLDSLLDSNARLRTLRKQNYVV
jgi:hypothetical protein